MKKQVLMAVTAIVAAAIPAVAEVIRPTLTLENRFPEPGRAEFSAAATYLEFTDESEQDRLDDANGWVVNPSLRYMATENLALLVEVPFGGFDPDVGDEESGLGDVAVGFQFRAYEHFFRFPYIIPHGKIKFDTGDDDLVGISNGETSVIVGVTIGSKVYDLPVYSNLDVRYEIFDDSENIFTVAGSFLWELSDKFSVLAEAAYSDQEEEGFLDDEEHPALFGGGLNYQSSERATISFYGGGAKNALEDVIATVRVTYDL